MLYLTIEAYLEMDTSEVKGILREVDLFARLDDELLDAFAEASTVIEFDAGDRLVGQGDPAGAVWVIVEGELEARRNSKPVAIFGPGDVGGDLSLLSGQPHSVDGIFKSAGRVVRLGADEFKAAVRHHPEVAWEIIRVLVGRIYGLLEAVEQARRQAPRPDEPPHVGDWPKPDK